MAADSKLLNDLLLELFSERELRQFLTYLPYERNIERYLPGSGVSLSELVFEAVRVLEQHGLINDVFFQQLIDARPQRQAEIRTVQTAFASHVLATTPEHGMEALRWDSMLEALARTIDGIFAEQSPPEWLFRVAGIDTLATARPATIDWREVVALATIESSVHRLVAAVSMDSAARERLEPVLKLFPSLRPQVQDALLQQPIRLIVIASEVDREARDHLTGQLERMARFQGGIMFEVASRLPDDALWASMPPDVVVFAVSPSLLDSSAVTSDEVTRMYTHQAREGIAVLAVLIVSGGWDTSHLARTRVPLVSHEGRGVFDVLFGTQDPNSSTAQEVAWSPFVTAIRSIVDQQRIRRILASLGTSYVESPTMETPRAIPPRQLLKLIEVFRTGGVPGVTFTRPTQFDPLVQQLQIMGIGLVVEGPSGIGKTVAVQKALETLSIGENRTGRPPIGIANTASWYRPRRPTDAEATRVEALVAADLWELRGYHVIDDFHLLSPVQQQLVGDQIKRLADANQEAVKIIVIGIPLTGETLAALLGDAFGRLHVLKVGRERSERIDELVALGERALNIRFLRRSEIVVASEGSFSLAQQLCYHVVDNAGIRETCAEPRDLDGSPSTAAEKLLSILKGTFHSPLQEFLDAQNEDRRLVAAAYYTLLDLAASPEGSVRLADVVPRHLELAAAFSRWEAGLTAMSDQEPKWRKCLQYDAGARRIYTQDPRLSWYLRWMDKSTFGIHCGLNIYYSMTDRQIRVNIGTHVEVTDVALPNLHAQPAPPQRVVRILHLSDLHFQSRSAWDSGTVLQRLQDDIVSFRSEWSPDVVVITGDVANAGKPEEYQLAADFFRTQLLPTCKLDTTRLILVPGNHDVDRQAIGSLGPLLQKDVLASRNHAKLAQVLGEPDARNALLRRHSPWLEFLNGFGGHNGGWDVPWRGIPLAVRDVKLHFAALCSSLFCTGDGDHGSLVLGLPQVNQAFGGSRAAHVVVSVLHHPWSYFTDWDDDTQAEIHHSSSVVLRGHLHTTAAVHSISPVHGGVVELAAGASYESSSVRMAYLLVELDVGNARLRVQCRSWDPQRRGWRLDLNAFEGDWWETPMQVFQPQQ